MKLERPGSEIHYEISGKRDAPVIVFANSLGTDLRVWDALLSHLEGFQFLRYDKRGHGKSSCDGPFGMQDLVHDAIAVIEAAGAKDVIFVGLSIGGLIGQGVCAQRPDLVRGFVLMDSAAKIGNEDFWNDRIAMIEAEGLEGIAAALMPRWFTQDFIDQGLAKPWQAMVAGISNDGYIGCCAAIAQTDLRASSAKLTLPTLAIAGSDDGSTPPDVVRETADLIEGSIFKIINKAGHLPCVERPEETASLIKDFARRLSEGLK